MPVPNYILASIDISESCYFHRTNNISSFLINIIKPYELTDKDINFIAETIKNFTNKNIIIKIPTVPTDLHDYFDYYNFLNYKQISFLNISELLANIKNIDIKELTIEYPELKSDINFDLSNKLPPTLKTFKLIINAKSFDLYKLPEGLENLVYYNKNHMIGDFYHLPAGLKTLKLTLDHNYPNIISDLPHGLQELYLDFAYKNSLDFLPQNLKYLDLRHCREQDKSNLPNTITKLILYNYANNLPDSVEEIYLMYIIPTDNFTNKPRNLKKLATFSDACLQKYKSQLTEIEDKVKITLCQENMKYYNRLYEYDSDSTDAMLDVLFD